MKEYIKNNLNQIANFIFFVIIIILEFIVILTLATKEEVVQAKEIPQVENSNVSTNIKIEIKGAIVSPGVYEIEKDSRVIDAINLAGGLLDNANTTIINLSKKLQDEMVIIIYTNEDLENYQNDHTKIEYIYLEKECVCPDKINQACISKEEVYATETSLEYEDGNIEDAQTEKESINEIELININTASEEQLLKLSGVGESKVQKIIEYRKQTPFQSIEDITNVSGIGSSIYEKIKNQITV